MLRRGARRRQLPPARPSCSQHGNLAQVVAPRYDAFWLVARCLLSLLSPQLLLHREAQHSHLVSTYVTVPKTPEREITWLQRLMTLGKAPKPPESSAAKTVIVNMPASQQNKAAAVRFASKANIAASRPHFRFTPESGH